MGSCVQPFNDLANKKADALTGRDGLFGQINSLTDPVKNTDFHECRDRRDPATLKSIQLGERTNAVVKLFSDTAEVGRIVLGASDRIRLTCKEPDVKTCDISALAADPQKGPGIAPVGAR